MTSEDVSNNAVAVYTILPCIVHIITASVQYSTSILDSFKEGRGYPLLQKLLHNASNDGDNKYVNTILLVIVDFIPLGPEYQTAEKPNKLRARNFEAFDVIVNCFKPYFGTLPLLNDSSVVSDSNNVNKVSEDEIVIATILDKERDIQEARDTELFLAELIHGIMGLLASHPDNFQIMVHNIYYIYTCLLRLNDIYITCSMSLMC